MELVVLTCSVDSHGNYWNRDLAMARAKPAESLADIDRQLASLDEFSDKLAAAEKLVKSKRKK